jgi:hypothetical protein
MKYLIKQALFENISTHYNLIKEYYSLETLDSKYPLVAFEYDTIYIDIGPFDFSAEGMIDMGFND